MFSKPTYKSLARQIKGIAKSFRWFLTSPHNRLNYIWHKQVRNASKIMHCSVELHNNLGNMYFKSTSSIGKRTKIRVLPNCIICVADNVYIGDDCEIEAFKTIDIGSNVSIQNRSIILGNVIIGAGCVCGPNLYISSGSHHFSENSELPIQWQDKLNKSDGKTGLVKIGEDCWLGINVFISPGITIGRGCIVGANAVVTKDLAPYSIAAGVPAIVRGKRLNFNPPQTIRSWRETDIPYFYSGFEQFSFSEDDTETLAPNGWRASHKFTLAISLIGIDSFLLHINSSSAGQIFHNQQVINICKGKSSLSFKSHTSNSNLLDFEWKPSAKEKNGYLLVIGVN